MAFKINNNFYDNITIYDVDYNEIFHGNYEELIQFMESEFEITIDENTPKEEIKGICDSYQMTIDFDFNVKNTWIQSLLNCINETENKFEQIFLNIIRGLSDAEILELDLSDETISEKYQSFYSEYDWANDLHEVREEILSQVGNYFANKPELTTEISLLDVVTESLTREQADEFMFMTKLCMIHLNDSYYVMKVDSGQGESYTTIQKLNTSTDFIFPMSTWLILYDYSLKLNQLTAEFEEKLKQ
jgi:hypothetical protein